ncbi:response regulator [Aeromicrobium sp. Leaf350]|uniref:response regulator n=1 Tax=Aeromicrobium sp. Leaf350 TaxID=2876565 RepID=UPI001E373844|nr:response regulator [Aeromicrobium sp. Leaf350]
MEENTGVGSGRRVLVVDDTASIRFLIRMNLELAGFEVEEAVDGVDALEVLRAAESLPDAVTIDVMMPRMDGISATQAIRADPALRDLVVVMVTTQGHPTSVQRGWDVGVDAYVVKPFDPDHLVATVAELVESGRR